MRPATERSYHQRLLRVLVHIQEHLDENPTLAELARLAHFSPYHFHRIFRGMVGETLGSHLRRLRLERAALRLKQGQANVLELALEAGYESGEAFARAFRAHFGCTPSAFRRERGAGRRPGVGVPFTGAGPDRFRPVGGAPPLGARIVRGSPLRIAFMRHVGPYDAVGETWDRFMAWVRARGLAGPAMRLLGVPHDDPDVTPPAKLRYDAALVVGPGIEAEGEVGVRELPGGDHAMAYHRGPYQELSSFYARLCGVWLPTTGREPRAAPALEFYLNSPKTTPPEDLYTEVRLPLDP